MWFIRRWVVTYLAVQESYYSELSLALVAAFGEGKYVAQTYQLYIYMY